MTNPTPPLSEAIARIEQTLSFLTQEEVGVTALDYGASMKHAEDIRLVLASIPSPAEGGGPIKMLVGADWLAKHVETDPDLDTEASSVAPKPAEDERERITKLITSAMLSPASGPVEWTDAKKAAMQESASRLTDAILSHLTAGIGETTTLMFAVHQAFEVLDAIEQSEDNVFWVNHPDPETFVGDAYAAVAEATAISPKPALSVPPRLPAGSGNWPERETITPDERRAIDRLRQTMDDYDHQDGQTLQTAEDIRRALTALERLSSAPSGGWRDISSAPKDGTVVDVWVVGPGCEPHRVANAYFGRVSEWDSCEECWLAPGYDYEGGDGEFETAGNHATHWRELPSPPSGAAKEGN